MDDEYVDELQTSRRTALWRAELTDGSVVVMDDGRPGAEPSSAWLRLGDRCRAEKLGIRSLWLGFRTNVHRNILPTGAAGYFFSRSALAFLNSGESFDFYLVGHLEGDTVHVQRWSVPELIHLDTETRPASTAGACLIIS